MDQTSKTNQARAQRCELLIDLCYDFVQHPVINFDFSPLTERRCASRISSFIDGIASMQIFPMTKPKALFWVADYSAAEALQRDWSVVGNDLCGALIKELDGEVKRLALDQSNVESPEHSRA